MLIVCKNGNWAKDDITTGRHYYAKEGTPCNVSEAEGQFLIKQFPDRFEEYSPPGKVDLQLYKSPKTFTDIIVPTYENEKYTIACFKSIKECTNPGTYRIIWVDNNSGQTSVKKVEAVLKDVLHTKIILDKNEGFVGATNAGLKASKAPTVCLLNNDTLVTPNWLSKLTSTLLSNDIGIIGAMSQPHNIKGQHIIQQSLTQQGTKYEFPTNKDVECLFKQYKTPVEYETWAKTKGYATTLAEYNKLLEGSFGGKFAPAPKFVAFYCAVLRREVINEVGYLNPEYGIGLYDDCDYCDEAILKGFNLAVALDTMIYHKASATFEVETRAGNIDFQKALAENAKIYEHNRKRRLHDARSLSMG